MDCKYKFKEDCSFETKAKMSGLIAVQCLWILLFFAPSSYPPSVEKLLLAKNIVNTFPSLRVQIEEKGDGFVSSILLFLEIRVVMVKFSPSTFYKLLLLAFSFWSFVVPW